MNLVLDAICGLWTAILKDEAFATRLISVHFRTDKRLGSKERKLVTESLYGMLRQYRRLVHVLETGTGQRADSMQPTVFYSAWALLEGQLRLEEAASLCPRIPWKQVLKAADDIWEIPDMTLRFALVHSLPDWAAASMVEEFGLRAGDLAKALNQRAPLTLRTNTLKTTREKLLEALTAEGAECEPTKYSPLGIELKSHVNVFGLASFKAGLFEVQDEGSQLASLLVAPPPGGGVLDFCAGAGGKTLAVAAALGNKGQITAVDVSASKLEELVKRARRAGVSNVRTMVTAEDAFPKKLEALKGRCTRALVDVPCSGVGSWRRNPEARWHMDAAGIGRFPELQFDIARRAADYLAPGGRLIYVTCTVFRAENENNVERLLAELPDFEVVRPAEIWGGDFAAPLCDPSGLYMKTFPHIHGADGFFAAVLRKTRGGKP